MKPALALVAGPSAPAAQGLSAWDGLRYGALGAPLAFAALPLYVQLPSHYGGTLGVPLAALGAILLGTRVLDALIDPALGRLADRALNGPRRQALALALLAALCMAGGFAALFLPQVRGTGSLLVWCATSLVITCLGYSMLGVLHQAWGARLGGDAARQARIVGWREGLALAGVLAASVLPALAGVQAMVASCLALLLLSLWALAGAPYRLASPRPTHPQGPAVPARADPWLAWRQPAFTRLMAVFLLNGVASAIPATLVLFFIRDRLQAPAWEPAFLGAYFAAAALSMPVWVRAVARWGLWRCWLTGMGMSVSAFIWAARLGPGDTAAFAVICLASGAALGADLAIPGALLAGVIRRAGHALHHEGHYFGWWTCVNKLNLALAAGLALPLLQTLGYAPGASSTSALTALALIYAGVPCLLKLAAAALLWHQRPHLDLT